MQCFSRACLLQSLNSLTVPCGYPFLLATPFFVFPSISIFSVPHPQPHTSQIPFSIVIYATMLACLSWRILHRCFERCRNRLGCRREFCSRVARRDRKPDRRWWDVHLLLHYYHGSIIIAHVSIHSINLECDLERTLMGEGGSGGARARVSRCDLT